MQATDSSDASVSPDLKFELEFASRFCESVGTPFAAGQYMFIKNDLPGAAFCAPNPVNYQEPTHFAEDYAVAELLTKSMNLIGFDEKSRKSAARTKFLECEVQNSETNTRLWCFKQPSWFGEFSSQVLRVLGPLDTSALNAIADYGKFGPGAAVGVRSDGLVPSIKFDANPVCTERLVPLLPGVIPPIALAYNAECQVPIITVPGNSHFTVPKNYKIERCAAKEPLWNSFLQLGIGSYMSQRLERFGVNLHDQTRNQRLAEAAYEGGLSTLDLSSASDLMSRVLVKLALTYNGYEHGERWLHLLDLSRSPKIKIDGAWRDLEMYSSMGNGFTFPLETVLFLAVCRCTVPRPDWDRVAVYGDDIIAPRQYMPQIVERLVYLGFKVNSSKTCLAGTFFESCGTDWFKARNVRPFYLHRDPQSGIPYALQTANALRAWCLRVYGYLPNKYFKLWNWCKSQVPMSWRYPIPSWMGDVGLHMGIEEALLLGVEEASKHFPQFEGYYVKYAALTPTKVERKTWGVLIARLAQHGPSEAATLGFEPLRGLFGRVRTKRLVVIWNDDFVWAR